MGVGRDNSVLHPTKFAHWYDDYTTSNIMAGTYEIITSVWRFYVRIQNRRYWRGLQIVCSNWGWWIVACGIVRLCTRNAAGWGQYRKKYTSCHQRQCILQAWVWWTGCSRGRWDVIGQGQVWMRWAFCGRRQYTGTNRLKQGQASSAVAKWQSRNHWASSSSVWSFRITSSETECNSNAITLMQKSHF